MAPADLAGRLQARAEAMLRGEMAVFDSVYPTTHASGSEATLIIGVLFPVTGLPALVLPRRHRADSLAIVELALNGRRSLERTPLLHVRPVKPTRGVVHVRDTARGRHLPYALGPATT